MKPVIEKDIPLALGAVIEKGIPLARKRSRAPLVWGTLDLLEVGESALFRNSTHNAHQAIQQRYQKGSPKRFALRAVAPDTVRVWRLS